MIFLILLINFWQSDSIIGSTFISDIAIGNGRNDDTLRLYAGNWGELLEYTYHSAGWMIDTVDNSCAIECIDLGNVRNDDTLRIYGAGYTDVYEYTYRNGSWQKNVIATISDPIWPLVYCLEIGPGRNDDTMRIYLGHWNCKIYELSYRMDNWVVDSIVITPPAGSITNMVIGPGRNDGINRLYSGGSTNILCEFTYFLSGWQRQNFGWAPGTYCGIALGNGRNDGINRIYSWSFESAIDGYVMYQWTGPAWTSQVIGQGIGSYAGVCLGIGRNDSLYRVYGFTGSNIYEFSYQAGWQQLHIDSIIRIHSKVIVGQGRNDSVDRVYVGCNNGCISEYTWIEEAIHENIEVEPETQISLKIQPNPFSEKVEINFIPQKSGLATITIFDITGRMVDSEVLSVQQGSECSFGWPKCKRNIPAGVYLCVLECDHTCAISKIVKIEYR